MKLRAPAALEWHLCHAPIEYDPAMSSHRWVRRHSRCCHPQNPPLSWIEWIDDDHESVIAFAEWLEGLPRLARAEVVSRIDVLCDKAARGDLVVGEPEIEPIVTNPDLYELRWKLLTKHVRQYHGEPAGRPEHLVKLHIHIKADSVRQEASERSQQQEIDWAIHRYNK